MPSGARQAQKDRVHLTSLIEPWRGARESSGRLPRAGRGRPHGCHTRLQLPVLLELSCLVAQEVTQGARPFFLSLTWGLTRTYLWNVSLGPWGLGLVTIRPMLPVNAKLPWSCCLH